MGRRTAVITITDPGRDKGKQFVLTEMFADQGERWVYRTLLALSRGGIDLPPGIFERGFAGFAELLPYLLVVGLRALHGAQWAELEPLLDEMMECIKFQPPGTNGNPQLLQPLFPGHNCQIEEIGTRAMLRKEVLQLHAGFSLADAFSTLDPEQSPPEASA